MDPERTKLLTDIQNVITEIEKLNPETLKREGRDYEFTDIYSILVEVYKSIDQLKKIDDWLDTLPIQKLQIIYNNLVAFNNNIQAISNFSPDITSPQDVRNSLANTIKNIYDVLFDSLVQPVKVESVSRRSSKSSLSNASKIAEQYIENMKKNTEEIEGLLESAKKATAQTGITVNSGIFDVQAEKNNKSARKWLTAGIIISIILIIYLVYVTFTIKNSTDIPSIVTKLFLTTIGYYVLYQVIKNYNVNMHLHTLNIHRANVLKTFESFVKSSDDPHIKDLLLTKAADAIFNSGETGYLSGKDHASKDGLEQLIQVNPLIDSIKNKS
jgi:cation transport regulator ChaB